MKLKVPDIVSIGILIVGLFALRIDPREYNLFILARIGIPLLYAIGGYFIFKPDEDIRLGTGLIIFNSFILSLVLFLTLTQISSSSSNKSFFWYAYIPCAFLIALSVLILYLKNKEQEKQKFIRSVLIRNSCIFGFAILIGILPASLRMALFFNSDSSGYLKYKQFECLNEADRYLGEKNYSAAVNMALEAVNYSKKRNDTLSSLYRNSLNTLGYCYYANNQNDQADIVYQLALSIPEDNETYDNELKRTLYYCGMLYSDMGYYAKSDSMLNQCLTRFKNKNEDLTYLYSISATNQKERGFLIKADSLYRLSLEKHKASDYIQTDHYISTLCDLGNNCTARSLFIQADSAYQTALAAAEKNYGRQSTGYASVTDNLMLLSIIQADYTKAGALGNQSLQIKESILGTGHSDYLYTLAQTAYVKMALSEYESAKTSLLSCLSSIEKNYGLKSPLACSVYDNLVHLYEDYEQYNDAEFYADKSLEARKEYYGLSNINTAQSIDNKAYLLYCRGKLQEADSLYDKSLRIRIRYTGRNNPGFAKSLNGWGLVLTAQNNLLKADTVLSYASEVLEECVGEKHPDYAQVLNNQGWIKVKQQRFDEAEQYFRKSLSINLSHFSEKHLKVAVNYLSLAHLKKLTGSSAEALTYFKKSLEIYLGVFGSGHPKILVVQKEIELLQEK